MKEKYCDKFKNKPNLNITKIFLIKEYVSNKKSAYKIAKDLKCSSTIIYYYLKKYNIRRRTLSQAQIRISKNKGKDNGMYGKRQTLIHKNNCLRGKTHPNFKHGKTFSSNFCIICNRKINWKSIKCQVCASKAKWQKIKYIKSQMKARSVKQNRIEKFLEIFLNKLLPKQYKFVGDGKIILGGFCPDFINCNGQKKIIELFGNYWHRNTQKRDKIRINTFKNYGYKTLIIWERELKSIDKVKNRILEFNKEN